MAATVTISSKGQLVIPSRIRKKYKLNGGTKVEVAEENGMITIRPNLQEPYDALIALRGVMSHIEEDVEGWWTSEKRKEFEREEAL